MNRDEEGQQVQLSWRETSACCVLDHCYQYSGANITTAASPKCCADTLIEECPSTSQKSIQMYVWRHLTPPSLTPTSSLLSTLLPESSPSVPTAVVLHLDQGFASRASLLLLHTSLN